MYYLATAIRNLLFDRHWLKSNSYSLPILAVGNLNVGGTGKSPMVEYVIKLFSSSYKVATLSRGYKRKTRGFVLADDATETSAIGDEPMQFFKKFPEIHVAVDEDRQHGIAELIAQVGPDLIVLDDAFQHRKVTAGYYIMLTAYDDLFYEDYLLPAGNLREPRSGKKRAHDIIVTKCPNQLSVIEQDAIIKKLKPLAGQQVFFTSIVYGEHCRSKIGALVLRNIEQKFHLVTGIANPKTLVDHLISLGLNFEHSAFPDHHQFNDKEIARLQAEPLVLTTEKDYMRLHMQLTNCYYIPIEIAFLNNAHLFKDRLLNFVAQNGV
jgi:tetraacyldisaccharide 4'-kinase